MDLDFPDEDEDFDFPDETPILTDKIDIATKRPSLKPSLAIDPVLQAKFDEVKNLFILSFHSASNRILTYIFAVPFRFSVRKIGTYSFCTNFNFHEMFMIESQN